MAKGFVGKGEKLTPAEKRLIGASRSKLAGRGIVWDADKPAMGDPGTRTGTELGKVLAKLKRLESVALQEMDEKAKAKKAKAVRERKMAEKPPRPAGDIKPRAREKRNVEDKMGVTRKGRL